jgi:hypothetical protein
MTGLRRGVGLLAATAVVVGCSAGPPSPTTPRTVGMVVIPPPYQRGASVAVSGTVHWLTGHPGCSELITDWGQRLHLTGPVAESSHNRARDGDEFAQVHVEIAGYVPVAAPSMCGMTVEFVTEKVRNTT